jgi:small subunit ribosomal protein S4e
MHLNRNNIGKFWPIPRKGTKYLAVPSYNHSQAIPLIVVVRDILKLVTTKKELKSVLNDKKIKVNKKEIHDCNYPLCLFDVLTLVDSKKNYRVNLSTKKKMELIEINEKESEIKAYKVLNKKLLKNKQVQLNLMNGINIISKEKVNTKDSVLLNFKENKIIKVLPMKKGETAFVTHGKHTGISGKIDDLIERGGKQIAKIKFESEKVNVWTKNIIIIE